MVKGLIFASQTMIRSSSSMILFANKDLAMDAVEFLENRLDNFTKYKDDGISESWSFTYDSISGRAHGILLLCDISCKNYKDQPIVYLLEIKDSNKVTKISDLYINKNTVEGIANYINLNSDAYTASISDTIVIDSEEALSALKRFLTSDKDIGEQWEYFSKIKP